MSEGRSRLARNAGQDRLPNARKPPSRDSFTVLAVCGLLVVAVCLVFSQTLCHEFVNFDDPDYVTENRTVAAGFTADGFVWAFSHFHNGNWHPLTWLSHMLDCQFFGANHAGGHHLTAVLLHAANTVLLFLVLRQMAGGLWRSAIVAALFGVHPLHVESVAWVAERKDVLSGLFFMLALAAYARYARRPFSAPRYLLVTLLFVLGLMSKPMLVTLPFVLLLLDYWPLARLGTALPGGLPLSRVLFEKLPWLGLSAASCVVTYFAQRSSESVWHGLPLPVRVANALLSYVVYLGQYFCPTRLAAFYPHPRSAPAEWRVACCLLLLIGISLAVVAWRARRPYLAVGWLWYLGMLVPVIGLVQVGAQAMADRYMYLPQIGLSIALAWGVDCPAKNWRSPRARRGVIAAAVLALLTVAAWRQAAYWKDRATLWPRVLVCTSKNSLAENSYGAALAARGDFGGAIRHFQKALDIDNDDERAHSNLGIALAHANKVDEAIVQFEEVLRIKPNDELTRNNLGFMYFKKGQFDKAIEHLQRALDIDPNYARARDNLAAAKAAREGAKTLGP
jgi:hypothetical protein